MDTFPVLPALLRWVHILSASLAIGVPIFLYFVLLPAMAQVLDPPTVARLREAINRPWRIIVYSAITALILTGLYNFFFVANPSLLGSPHRPLYHMLFGFKMIFAIVIFVLASALPGRMRTLAFLRANMRKSLLTLILLLLATLALSNILRTLRDASAAQKKPESAAMLQERILVNNL